RPIDEEAGADADGGPGNEAGADARPVGGAVISGRVDALAVLVVGAAIVGGGGGGGRKDRRRGDDGGEHGGRDSVHGRYSKRVRSLNTGCGSSSRSLPLAGRMVPA